MKLRSGETVTLTIPGFDQVELIDELGSGGDGHVWKIKPLSPGKAEFYVLKSIRLDPEQTDEQRADHVNRIRREASVFVDSPYIIKCLGLCEVERDCFVLLFPYEPGGNFDEWIRTHRDSSLSQKKTLFLKILDGVQALHQAQIIHRDLKPKNILVVMPDETPRIFDFGLAKFRNRASVTEVGTIAGTDAYIAPEVFGWGGIKGVDERCDIYALGIILYELIVGKNPWRANGWKFGDFADYLQKQNRDGGDSAFKHILHIDAKFDCTDGPIIRAIEYATMFEPSRRFHSVEQLRQTVQGRLTRAQLPRLIDYVPHDGDTFEITQQALSNAQETPIAPQPLPDDIDFIDLTEPDRPAEAPAITPPLPNEHAKPDKPDDAPKPKTLKLNHRNDSPPPHTQDSGCGWLLVLVIALIGLFFGGLGLGAWGLYRWWHEQRPIQVIATPAPRPTATPKPRAVKRPTATPTPRPKPTSTSRPKSVATPRPRPTAAPTSRRTVAPTLAPTPTPRPGVDPNVVTDLQKILGGKPLSDSEDSEVTPAPTRTPTTTPTPTATPEQDEAVNLELLENLLLHGE